MNGNSSRWVFGMLLLGGLMSAQAMADDSALGFGNPLNLYIGGGVGRSEMSEPQVNGYDPYFFDASGHVDGHPLGWEAVIGIRPISFLGAEAEYLDFGTARTGAGPKYTVVDSSGASLTSQDLGSGAHDRAVAAVAVGYLPLPVPFIEPFAKFGVAYLWTRNSYSGDYQNEFINGVPVGLVSSSNSGDKAGVAYGAGVQFRLDHVAVRAQFEGLSIPRHYGAGSYPSLISIGANWTF